MWATPSRRRVGYAASRLRNRTCGYGVAVGCRSNVLKVLTRGSNRGAFDFVWHPPIKRPCRGQCPTGDSDGREATRWIRPGLPATDNFQHWEPWRPLAVETAWRVLEYTGGTRVMPVTVSVESYWREISGGLTEHGIPIHHFVLHADQATLRERIQNDKDPGP